MGGDGKRWRGFESSRRRRSQGQDVSSEATAASPARPSDDAAAVRLTPPPPPKEFLCPISCVMMADPVVLPDGRSFERACVKACIELGLDSTSTVAHDDCPVPAVSSATPVVTNSDLRGAIFSWCDSHGHDRPRPVELNVAIGLVRAVLLLWEPPPDSGSVEATANLNAVPSQSVPSSTTSSLGSTTTRFPSYGDAKPAVFASPTSRSQSRPPVDSVDDDDSSSAPDPPPPCASELEDRVVGMLASTEVADQENALHLLRYVTREHSGRRAELCTERLLRSLIPLISSSRPTAQADAIAAIVNLSLHPSNKVPIVRARAVPPLVAALSSPHSESRSQAASAIFGLSVVDENKAVIGTFGTIPLLVDILSNPNESAIGRRDAALGLHHLTRRFSGNLSKLVNLPGSARALLNVVSERSPRAAFCNANGPVPNDGTEPTGESDAVAGAALLVILNMTGSNVGRSALMDAGAVEAVVGILKALRCGGAGDVPAKKRRELCVALLYGIGKESLRFRALAAEAGVEEVLHNIVAATGEVDGDGEDRWRRTRERAKKILQELGGGAAVEFHADEGGSDCTSGSTSDLGLSSVRLWRRDAVGNIVGVNSSEL